MTRQVRPARRREPRRPTQAPDEDAARPRWFGPVTWIAIGIVAAGLGLWLAKTQSEAPAEQVAPPPSGLPHTPDYHALLVSPTDARHIVLGTHAGLYVSSDSGRRWGKGELAGQDAMNLVRTSTGTVWVAGHNVLFRSKDDGRSWAEARPSGLPGLDLHGFAADPRDADLLYAAVAGEGLYRSNDGGRTFEVISANVGSNVFGLAVTPAGRILAADPSRGVYASEDGGRTWTVLLQQPALGVAVNPSSPSSVLATGSGVFLSGDGGKRWRRVLAVEGGVGPVAWAPSNPRVAYAIGGERLLYRSTDGGRSWRAVR